MVCPHCGAELADEARFCVECGTALDGTQAMPVANPAVAPAPAGSPAPSKKSKKGVVIAIVCAAVIVVGGGGGLAYHLYQQHVQEQEQYESAHSKHALVVSVEAEGWDTDDGASRVPVRVKGKTVDGKKIDKVEYVASDGSGIKLIQGTYTLKAAGSPIAADGTIYQVPCTKAELTIDDVFTKGEKIDLGELAEQDSILDFTPIEAAEVTDDEINDAVTLAMAYKGKDAPNVDVLRHAATNRRDTAVAAKEDEQRKAAEERKAAALHAEAQTFMIDLPEYWSGQVLPVVKGDKIVFYASRYPSKEIGWVEGFDHKAEAAGDVATSITKDLDLGNGRYVEIWIRRWAYDAAMHHLPAFESSSPTCTDDEASIMLNLQSMGTVSLDTIISEMQAANAPSSDTLFTVDKIYADALAAGIKAR